MTTLRCILSIVALVLLLAESAGAVTQFDAFVTQVNGQPVGVLPTATVEPSDIVRVELWMSNPSEDQSESPSSASMPMTFDPSRLILVGPGGGPTTFHQPCNFGGVPCSLIPGAASSSGSATPDSQENGTVGAVGYTTIGPGVPVPVANALGVVDFHVLPVHGLTLVSPFVQFPGVDGVFQNFGTTPLPFTIGPGATILVVPEPATTLLVLVGLAGAAAVTRRRGGR